MPAAILFIHIVHSKKREQEYGIIKAFISQIHPNTGMRNTVFVMLALVATASLGSSLAFAQAESDSVPYPAKDVFHTLENIDLFVTLDDRYHMIVDEAKANNSPEITETDLAIARDYAIHHNAVIDESAREHTRGDKSQPSPEMWAVISDLEDGKFSNVFNYKANGDQLAEQMTSFGDAAGLLIFIYHLLYLY